MSEKIISDENKDYYDEGFEAGFRSGYQYAKGPLPWIGVRDMLPEENTLVLVAGDRGGMFLGKISSLTLSNEKAEFKVPNARTGSQHRLGGYWLPLPKHPKEGDR